MLLLKEIHDVPSLLQALNTTHGAVETSNFIGLKQKIIILFCRKKMFTCVNHSLPFNPDKFRVNL